MEKIKKNILLVKSFEFAIEIVKLYKYITTEKKEFVMSRQLLRSGTAIGALVRKAQNAESKLDFIHKLAIAQKECDETIYWLDLILATDFINNTPYETSNNTAGELLKIIR
ncbi:MAG: four helix bundle protein [Bacteroidota bacterium]|nr:four helix bundle protein [Bacteroidota bacterium]